MELFHFQAQENPIYRKYLKLIKRNPEKVVSVEEIPFLPIHLFKEYTIVSGRRVPEKVFLSSGTGQVDQRSKHYVSDLALYEWSFLNEYQRCYGDPAGHIVLALLPSYQENAQSSLLYMVQHLIRLSGDKRSSFINGPLSHCHEVIQAAQQSGKKVILFGVAYALLDLAEQFPQNLSSITIIETGGMKGRRKELLKQELHHQLCEAFHCTSIHSEYGMTELLSQAYSSGQGLFKPGSTLTIRIRDLQDPYEVKAWGRGAINIIDLCNVDSCAFIETEDLGMLHQDGSFEVLGRKDNSELRGCNLLYQQHEV